MENEYRIRRITGLDGKVQLCPLSDFQVKVYIALDEWVDAMKKASQKLNPPQPLVNDNYYQQGNLDKPKIDVSKGGDH
jgi:hypothetical protein